MTTRLSVAALTLLASAIGSQAATVTRTFEAMTIDASLPEYAAAFPSAELSVSYDTSAAPLNGDLALSDGSFSFSIGFVDLSLQDALARSLSLSFSDGMLTDFDFNFASEFGATDINLASASISGGKFSGEFFIDKELFFPSATLGAFTETTPIPLPPAALLLLSALAAFGIAARRRRIRPA
ncbi:MAG: hypothetical protein AAGD12_15975 [Pseudomonadota bacterium]